ncbi:MAG: winged helix-turn-helix domain-containing protein [Methanolobus sp.]|nr:winged helix-turn-helix domain-containing protein [Methanolobus sp.]
MSSFPLVDIVWLSQKRIKILMLLTLGPKTAEEIKNELELDLRALHLPLKELKEERLVTQEDDTFVLSELGRIISINAKPAYGLTNLFENNSTYWTSRNLANIPRTFARRLGELGDCELFEQDLGHMFQLPQKFINSTSKTENVMSVFSFFYPEQLYLYNAVAKKGGKVSLILTEGVCETLQENFPETFCEMSKFNNTEIYCLHESISPPAFTVTDNTLLISFFNKNGRYDHQDIFSSNENALKWGRELFSYYKDRASIRLTELQ